MPLPITQFQAEVLTAQGYEPFGALLPGRNWRQPLGPPPPPVTPQGTLVITELSNGPSGDCEYVELYVTKCSLYPDATEVDIRGWIIDDNAGNLNTEGGCTTGVGISSGHLRLADVPAWASVPVGSVIVLYNGNDNCYAFTAQEAGTGGQYFVDVNSTTLIERTGSGGTPSTSDCGYCDNSYTATSSSPSSWSTIAMGNSGDGIQVRCPDCPESEAGFFHGLAYGSDFGGLNAGGNDLGGAHVSGPGSQRSYELTGAGAPGDGAHWTRTTAPTGGTPPATAGVVDAGVIAGLEGASLTCCGSFEPPVLAQKQGYRWGFGGHLKDDEVHGSTGTWYSFGDYGYDSRIGRRIGGDPMAHEFPWQSPYSVFNNNPNFHVDPDGESPISILAKHILKQGFKAGIKKYAKNQIERRLKGYMSKNMHKQFLKDMDDLLGTLDSEWYDYLIEAIPIFGDAYGATKFGRRVAKTYEKMQDLENAYVKRVYDSLSGKAQKRFVENMRRAGVRDARRDQRKGVEGLGAKYERNRRIEGDHKIPVFKDKEPMADPRNIEFMPKEKHIDKTKIDMRERRETKMNF